MFGICQKDIRKRRLPRVGERREFCEELMQADGSDTATRPCK